MKACSNLSDIQFEVVKILLDHGADIEAKNWVGCEIIGMTAHAFVWEGEPATR